jgi:hypothetical protein
MGWARLHARLRDQSTWGHCDLSARGQSMGCTAVGWVACRVGSIESIGWLAGPSDGPIDPSPRVMNCIYVYVYVYIHTHTYIVVDGNVSVCRCI